MVTLTLVPCPWEMSVLLKIVYQCGPREDKAFCFLVNTRICAQRLRDEENPTLNEYFMLWGLGEHGKMGFKVKVFI